MPAIELKSLSHCVYALQYHLVIVTKYRKKCLTDAMLTAFAAQARERCVAWGGTLLEVNGEADHIHLLLELPPTVATADFVNALKTGTSRRLRSEFKEYLARYYNKAVLWSRSYCILSYGGAPLDVIKQYIQQQARPND